MEPWLESFARANFRRSGDTAHDLKTPLNVAVLNLELLRMRLRKLVGDDDEKILNYTRAIEVELRRMGRIFDAFFLLSTPPKTEGDPVAVDVAPIAAEEAAAAGFEFAGDAAGAVVRSHESRIRQALRMFFEGASKVLLPDGRRAATTRGDATFTLAVVGFSEPSDLDLTRLFKFYYTDPHGSPDLTLAVARLIAETYGGELNASQESGKVSMRLSLPLGER
jgi:nitrogen fixation/metabolism regulation signal transduction histidine kinase